MNYRNINNTEARELLNGFFHFSYHVYGIDKLIDQLEEIQERLPTKDEYGLTNTDIGEIQQVVISLRNTSRNIHEIMGATYGDHVKNYMDECHQ